MGGEEAKSLYLCQTPLPCPDLPEGLLVILPLKTNHAEELLTSLSLLRYYYGVLETEVPV